MRCSVDAADRRDTLCDAAEKAARAESSEAPRAIGVDALRGVAALAVCLFHWEHFAFATSNDQQWFRLGLLGVELFFMISGYVILMVAARDAAVQPTAGSRGQVARFVVARIVRLYPAYLVSVLLTAIYVLYVGKYSLGVVMANATMLQAFAAVPNITNPYWTLAFEITFYGLLAAVMAAGKLGSIERIALGVLAAGLVWRLALPHAMTLDDQRPLAQLGFILVAPQFMPFFVAGMMVFRWRAGRLGAAGKAALVAAVAVTLFGRGDFAQITGPIYFTATLLMVASLAYVAGVVSNAPLWRGAAWLGRMSYPLYLVHCTLANIALLAGAAAGWSPVWSVGLSVLASLALSRVITTRLEMPLQALYKAARRATAREPALAFGR